MIRRRSARTFAGHSPCDRARSTTLAIGDDSVADHAQISTLSRVFMAANGLRSELGIVSVWSGRGESVLEVRVLGQIEVVAAAPLTLGGPTQRRVLAVLALRRNEVVSVSHLVDVIWADGEAPERAAHDVRTYVHRLRSALGGHGDRVETVGAGYRLRLDAD